MIGDPKPRGPRLPWNESIEALLEELPGVVSATVEGPRDAVSEVRVWYEPTWPFGQVVDAVYGCLTRMAGARLADARIQAIVAHPDRRTAARTRPVRPPAIPVESTRPLDHDSPLRLVGHEVEEVQPGVIGVQVWIEWEGRRFSGAARGPAAPPGSLRTPALATLRALHSCLQVLHEGPAQPGLVLDWAARTMVSNVPVVVVALTASENARPRSLTAAWVEEESSELAVILATLNATSRTITRWLNDDPARIANQKRLALVDFEVDRDASGELDVGVRLSGFGQAVDRRRNGSDSSHLQLGAFATLDAVHDLMGRVGSSAGDGHAPNGGRGRDLRHTATTRLKTGEQDVVIVLAEASLDGRRIPLAGATSTDGGLERASITATLQATNRFVAERAAGIISTTIAPS